MAKEVTVPEIHNYLVFRYNLYMCEYMYEYIVEKIMLTYGEKDELLKVIFGKEKKEFLYKMFNSNRTDFSKYKHSDREQQTVTKKVRCTFSDYPELESFIIGKRLIIDRTKTEEYPNDWELELSEDTKDSLVRAVDNVWEYVREHSDMKGLVSGGVVLQLAGWMSIKIVEQYKKEKKQQEEIDLVVMREFEHISNISFEMIDACNINTIKKMVSSSREFYNMINYIYQYKTLKANHKR